jgi:hypothetical protein
LGIGTNGYTTIKPDRKSIRATGILKKGGPRRVRSKLFHEDDCMRKLIMEIDIDRLLGNATSQPQAARDAVAEVFLELGHGIPMTKVWCHRPAKIRRSIPALRDKVGYWWVVEGHREIGRIPDDV